MFEQGLRTSLYFLALKLSCKPCNKHKNYSHEICTKEIIKCTKSYLYQKQKQYARRGNNSVRFRGQFELMLGSLNFGAQKSHEIIYTVEASLSL